MKPPNETRLQRWTPINQADGETDQALRTRDGRCPGSRRCLPACLPTVAAAAAAAVLPSLHPPGGGGSFVAFLPTAIPCKGCSHRPFHFAPCLLALFLFCFVLFLVSCWNDARGMQASRVYTYRAGGHQSPRALATSREEFGQRATFSLSFRVWR